MAKWRALHASITTDGKVNRMSEFAQLLYDRMMVKANDWGVITGDSFELKGETVPLLSRNFQELDDAIQEMVDQDLVWEYEPEGYGPLVQIKKFDDHQPKSLIAKRSVPKLPLHPAWHPLPDDDRSIQLLESLESSRKRTPRVDKSRVDKSRVDKGGKAKSRLRDPRLDHEAVSGYKDLARLNVKIALRDDWIACAEEVGSKHLLAIVKEWLGKGHRPQNVKGMMDVARDGWNYEAPKRSYDDTHDRAAAARQAAGG